MLFYSLEDLREYEKSGYDEHIAARITDKVKRALSDIKHLQEIADSGYECCEGRHSWIERAVVIEKYFR